MKTILLFMAVVFAGFANTATAQTPPNIPTTVTLKPVHATVWWDPTNGNDAGNGLTKATAKKTWAAVRDACQWWDPLTQQAEIAANGTAKHTQIIIARGVHMLTTADRVYQHYGLGTPSGSVPPFPDNYGGGNGNYRRHLGGSYSNPANWRPDLTKEISIVGETNDATETVLDATNMTGLNAGSGIIRLAGRGISIENLTIRNSPNSRAIDLRTDEAYNNVAGARQNNVLIKNVIIHNIGFYGIYIADTDGAVVENCVVYNTVLDNINGQKHTAGGTFVSAIKTSYTTNVAFLNNKVYNNWGEGLNFCKMNGGAAIGNEVHNNYSVNLYCDNVKDIVLRNNKAWQLSDRTYWRMHTNQPTVKRAAPNLSISNEQYAPETAGLNPRGVVERDAENIYAYNNIFHGSNITFGFSDRPADRTNTYTNIYIVNNTAIDVNADANVPLPLLNCVSIPNATLSNATTFTNFNIRNNIFSIPAGKLSSDIELARTSLSDQTLFQNFASNNVTVTNYWSANPYKASRNNFIHSADVNFNTNLPGSITDINTLSNIIPANDNNLKFAYTHESFVSSDFLGNTRRTSPQSNVGAIENTGDLLPVTFGNITAFIRNNTLNVNWSTLTETNNSYFEIEASVNGKDFTKIGQVISKTETGNSSLQLNYEFSSSLNGGALAAGIGMLLLGSAGFGLSRRKKHLFMLLAAAGIGLSIAGCTKDDGFSVEDSNSSLYIRIKQVDKDGSFEYSKVIKVVQE
ncbi:MAG: right-handed parallel beta-helix repeat-containing protein [Niabella sp.]